MSRIGKQPITLPSGTTVTVDTTTMSVKGPKGTLTRAYSNKHIAVSVDGSAVIVTPISTSRESGALWGTTAAHIKNMVKGVNEPFTKKLMLEGVGFKCDVQGKTIKLALGFSHPVTVAIPENLTVTADTKENSLMFTGIDRDAVGQFAAQVRALKKPEPYKGKGFRYSDEVVVRKQGKKASA